MPVKGEDNANQDCLCRDCLRKLAAETRQ